MSKSVVGTDEEAEMIMLLYFGIGQIVTTWAYIEQNIDLCIAMIFHSLEGRAIAPQLPRNTRAKIQYVRKALQQIPAFKTFSRRGLLVLEKAMSTKDFRHDLVHSAPVSHKSIKGFFYYVGVKPSLDLHTATFWDLNVLTTLPAHVRTLAGLAKDTGWLIQRFEKAKLTATPPQAQNRGAGRRSTAKTKALEKAIQALVAS